MSLLAHTFDQTCEILATTQNIYGDQVETDRVEYPCRLREITEIQPGNNREDLTGTDALLWIGPDAPIVEGSILLSEGKYWRVQRLTKARRFTSSVLFLKCRLEAHNGAIDAEELS